MAPRFKSAERASKYQFCGHAGPTALGATYAWVGPVRSGAMASCAALAGPPAEEIPDKNRHEPDAERDPFRGRCQGAEQRVVEHVRREVHAENGPLVVRTM